MPAKQAPIDKRTGTVIGIEPDRINLVYRVTVRVDDTRRVGVGIAPWIRQVGDVVVLAGDGVDCGNTHQT